MSISKLLTALLPIMSVLADEVSHTKNQPKAHSDTHSGLLEETVMGASPYFPMRFILPVGDDFGYTLLEVWNSVTGKYLEDQEWKFHARFIAEYTKEVGITHKAGVCFEMAGAYADTLDCVQVKAGQENGDDIVVLLSNSTAGGGIYN